MTERNDSPRTALRAYRERVRHPYLLSTVGIGLVLLLVGAVLASSAPTLGFRIGFVGAVVTLFGTTGYIAFWVNDRGSERRQHP